MTIAAQLGYLAFEVSDLGAWRRFATELMGLAVGAPKLDGALPLRMDDHDFRILLSEGSTDDVAYIGWEVADRAVLDVMKDRLARAGVPFQENSVAEAAARGVREMITLTDPDGIRTEIHHGPVMGLHEFRSNKITSGFKTGGMGMGHVLVNVRDCARTEQFYRDVLGFRLSDYIDTEFMGEPLHAVFLHVNRRHHSLAFASLGMPKRLHHVMLEANTIDDVGATFYRAQDLGVPIALTLGRHPNDGMISFYGVTPSGFLIELGVDGREVDDRNWEVKTYNAVSDWGHRPVTTA
ncbi:MAG: VOC family protein [Betaproteobacteria bacterium]|nr:VOC family protein [Betaproteobacteria bacterium]